MECRNLDLERSQYAFTKLDYEITRVDLAAVPYRDMASGVNRVWIGADRLLGRFVGVCNCYNFNALKPSAKPIVALAV